MDRLVYPEGFVRYGRELENSPFAAKILLIRTSFSLDADFCVSPFTILQTAEFLRAIWRRTVPVFFKIESGIT